MNIISVIVPVYNCERWLDECIESVLNQTFQEFELILVDDGSTDGSGMICDLYATKDERVRVFHKENGFGGGEARNYGIDKSRGDFIVFLDSDDCHKPDMLEQLYQAQQQGNYDLVVCGYNYINEFGIDGDTFCLPPTEIIGRQEVLDYFITHYPDGLLGYPWNKMYRGSIIREKKVFFPKMRRLEDGIFNVLYFDNIQSLCVIGKPLIRYRVNCQVALRKLPYNFYDNMKPFTKNYYEFLESHGFNKEEKENPFVVYFLNDFVCCLENILANCWEGKSRKDKYNYILQLHQEELVQYMLKKVEYVPTYSRLVLWLFQTRLLRILEAVIHTKLFLKENLKQVFTFLKKFN